MHESSDNTRVLENGFDSMGIRFEIQPDIQESLDKDDAEEMSGDEGDEEEEDEEEEEEDEDGDQDDHEIDEDDFDEEMIEEEGEDDGMRLMVEDHGFSNDALHVMPVEVFGSRRQGRTTSIYNLLGRAGDTSAPSQHPLLVEPSSSRPVLSRQAACGLMTSKVVDTSSIPSGLEDLLVSHLRPPTPETAPDTDTTVDAQTQDGTDQLQASSEMVPEPITENISNNESVLTVDESRQCTGATVGQAQSVPMQSEHNSVLRDVEAASEESSESEATLGESLRSLDVEIGSADGHDDSADRQA
ncbi:hypothetical protein Tco_0993504 [Tanacetum coccineum]